MALQSACDVLVVGAGPAGAAAALALASLSKAQVTLVDAGLRTPPLGETLAAAARPVLRDLGLWDAFVQQGHPPTLGLASRWGSDELLRRDAFADPQGASWRLDRQRFDDGLRGAALGRGVRWLPARVDALQGGPGQWEVRLQHPPGAHPQQQHLGCRFIVDATGRRAVVLRRLGVAVERVDSLLCEALALPPDPQAAPDLQGFALIEACADGWFYGSVLADGRRWLAFHTDADLASKAAGRSAALLCRLHATTDAARLAACAQPACATVHRTAAWSACAARAAGPGWAAVGDAACCFDPLSSQGLFHALCTGLRLGQTLARSGPPAQWHTLQLDGHVQEMARIWHAYLAHRGHYYRSEMRHAARPFWARRHASHSQSL